MNNKMEVLFRLALAITVLISLNNAVAATTCVISLSDSNEVIGGQMINLMNNVILPNSTSKLEEYGVDAPLDPYWVDKCGPYEIDMLGVISMLEASNVSCTGMSQGIFSQFTFSGEGSSKPVQFEWKFESARFVGLFEMLTPLDLPGSFDASGTDVVVTGNGVITADATTAELEVDSVSVLVNGELNVQMTPPIPLNADEEQQMMDVIAGDQLMNILKSIIRAVVRDSCP